VKQPATNLNGGSRPLDWNTNGVSSEYQTEVLPALLDGRKKHNGVENEELKTSKRGGEKNRREERKEKNSEKERKLAVQNKRA